MKTDYFYRARISSNRFTPAFDTTFGKTPGSAIASMKRKNQAWEDCFIWVEKKTYDYQWEKI